MEESDNTKFDFGVNFETKLMKLMMEDPYILAKSLKYIKPWYFSNKWLEWIYRVLTNYYEKYNKIPTKDVFAEEIRALPETEVLLEYVQAVKSVFDAELKEADYIKDKLQEWIQRNLFVKGFKHAVDRYNKNKFDDALTETQKCMEEIQKINFRDAHRSDFFANWSERMCKREIKQQETEDKFTTGVLELDGFMGGGIGRGELGIVGADTGVGKSIFCINALITAIRMYKCKGIYFNLEGKNDQLEDRLDSRFLNYNYHSVRRNELAPENFNEYDSLKDHLWTVHLHDKFDYTMLDVVSELEELKTRDFISDIIVVDYGDLLKPRNVSRENKYNAMEEVYQDLKTLAIRYNAVVWSPTQLGRPKADADPKNDSNFVYTRYNVSDSYNKCRVCDLFVTLNMTDAEKEQNRMRIYFDKYRDAHCGFVIPINTNYSNMQFYVPSATSYEKYARGIMGA